jgi:hypothetical protein
LNLAVYIRLLFAYLESMRNRHLVYLGSCIIAGLRLAREKQVNTRVVPTITSIHESVELAEYIFDYVSERVPATIGRQDYWGGKKNCR